MKMIRRIDAVRVARPPSGGTAAAFTLTEMMVVLVIIGLIAAIVGPRLFNRLDTAKQRTAHLQIENLATAVDMFRLDTGRLPSREEGLNVLVHAPTDGVEWLGPYLAKDDVPLDPWGRPYVYELAPDSAKYTIVSYGAYGKPGGEGRDAPISSETLKRQSAAELKSHGPENDPSELK